MKIVICGISGFVGSALKKHFTARGDDLLSLSVRSDVSVESIAQKLEGCDVLINLAGANILGRWTSSYKNVLRQSRLETTDKLTKALKHATNPPKVLLNASAVGIYDNFHKHDEGSQHFENDFLSTLVQEWEKTAMSASAIDVRVCLLRFGVVYGKGGGAMAKMLPPFKLGLGGKMGSGDQMISWIHLDDLVRIFAFLIDHPSLYGLFNATSPHPLSNADQTEMMGTILHRPTFMDMPSWLVKLIFGEGSSVILDSKEVYPTRLLEAGFRFNYPTFEEAMKEIVTI
ncbi:MAG: TIGR01777 family oxidoreductase [Campylobacterales bacterium]|nr:TIGR01777 family oxidoreductase [Campylobacterales bacterium]